MANKLTFKGGVHPLPKLHYGKSLTNTCAIEKMPPIPLLSVPCAQHIGAPATPVVQVGDRVKKGQKIAEPCGFVSVPVHAPVSGTVKAIVKRLNKAAQEITYIDIENDFQEEVDESVLPKGDLKDLSSEEIKKIILEAGNVGLGGAGFPTHVKLYPPDGKKINTIIINGAECEPFLTADHRVMLEYPGDVIFGLKALMRSMGVQLGFIAVEDNKPDAIETLERALDTNTIRVKTLKTKYPQGSEKQIIDAVLGRQVPSCGLPMDVGVVVVNASSAKAIADAILTGMPLIERVVTVTGYVNQPKNVLAKLGTPLRDVLEFCGGFKPGVKKIIAGGPMMGVALDSIDGVVSKTTSGLLALGDQYTRTKKASNCIRCGRCAEVCPIGLLPMYISIASDNYEFDKAEQYHAMDCISCGSCSYVCPANREIAQSIRLAKDEIVKARRKKQQK